MMYRSGVWTLLIFVVHRLLGFLPVLHASGIQKEFEWVDLSQSELQSWYTPADLCVLENSDRKTFPQDIRSRNCSQYSRGSRRMFCGVGMGNNNYPCYGPFTGRQGFKKGVRGYTDALATPLTNAIALMQKYNYSLVLAGDSTNRQKLQALYCEIGRESKKARMQGDIFGIVPCDTELKIYLPSRQPFSVYSVSLGPKSKECKAASTPDPASADAPDIAKHLSRIINKLRSSNQKIILVANVGLWYNARSEFDEVVPPLLSYLHSVAAENNNVVTWHETMTQHWISDQGTGYFDKGLVAQQEWDWKSLDLEAPSLSASNFTSHVCCRPIQKYQYENDWRNFLVDKHLQTSGTAASKIKVLPLASLTRPLHDLHTCNPFFKHDCTHYCYTPLLWQVFWHQMEQLMKEVQDKEEKMGSKG